MRWTIDADNGVPIFEQLVRQVQFAVARGILVPGQIVPSTRELARQLAINPNTVQRAYSELQNLQVLEPLRGRGVAVCPGAARQCQAERKVWLTERVQQVVDEAIQGGLAPDELRELFERVVARREKQQVQHSKRGGE